MQATFSNPNDRYRAATFHSTVSSGNFEFRLEESINGSNRVLVDKQNLIGKSDPRSSREVFLLRQARETGNWQASLWTRKDNPWINGTLQRGGGVVQGRVYRYLDGFGAILLGEIAGVPLEFAVFRENLPIDFSKKDIHHVLFEGELVAGILMAPDLKNLRISVDVAAWLQAQRNLWRTKRTGSSVEKEKEQSPENPDSLSGKKFLIIDDDRILVETISNQINHADGNTFCVHAGSEGGMLTATKEGLEHKPDFIILDRKLEDFEKFEQPIFDAVRKYNKSAPSSRVLLFTGQLEGARELATNHGFGFLEKPAIIGQLFEWFANPAPAERNGFDLATQQAHALFSVQSKMEQIIQRANVSLDEICSHHDLYGAIWFIEISRGRFELRSCSSQFRGLIPEATVEKLERSVVGDAVFKGEEDYGTLPPHDPIAQFGANLRGFPVRPHYFVYPLAYDDKSNRVIIFISKHLRIKFQVQHPPPRGHRMLRWTYDTNTSMARNAA